MSGMRISYVKKIVVAALIISLAVIVNMFRITVPVAGAPVMRISFSGVFLRFASILLGPAIGGIAGGLTDVISHLIKPEGAYILPLTVVEVLKGVTIGFLWLWMAKADAKKIGIAFLVFFLVLGVFGIFNAVCLGMFPGSAYAGFLSGIGKKTTYASYGIIIVAVIGLVTYAVISWVTEKRPGNDFPVKYLKLLFVTGLPCLFFTTVNTYVLMLYLILPDKAFVLLWIPRLIEEIAAVMANAYLLLIIIGVYDRHIKRFIETNG